MLADTSKPVPDRWALWLLGALLLHGLVFWIGFWSERQATAHRATPTEADSTLAIELDSSPSDPAAASASPLGPTVAANSTPLAKHPSGGAVARAPAFGTAAETPAALDAPRAEAQTGSESALPSDPSSVEAGLSASEPREPKGLGLAQLGIGANNPFVARSRAAPARRPSARETGVARFERSMAAEMALADQSVGLGPEGPVLAKLETFARSENVALRSSAVFTCTVDGAGKILSVELVQSSSDPVPWRRVAKGVHAALKSRPLRVAKTGYGVTFRMRVTSRVQLPSGNDPGVDVNLLGIPINKGEGPKSARVDILNVLPKVTESKQRLPSGQEISVPKLELPVISAIFDLADIGGTPIRMVRAHLERMDVSETPSGTRAKPAASAW